MIAKGVDFAFAGQDLKGCQLQIFDRDDPAVLP